MKTLQYISVAALFLFLASCMTEAPKYAKVEQVLTLKPGMTKQEISETLNIPPYDIKMHNDSSEVLIYKYRVTDRRHLSLFLKPTNGVAVSGKYVDLFVTYSRDGKATNIESCSGCGETKPNTFKLDFNRVMNFITVTTPALLLYIGLSSN